MTPQGADSKRWPFGVRVCIWSLVQAGLVLIAAGIVWGLGWVPETLWAMGMAMVAEAVALSAGYAWLREQEEALSDAV